MSGDEMTHPPDPSQTPIRAVAIIGAGTAGRSFALACTAAGFHVILEDVMPANLRRAQEEFADLTVAASNQSRGSLTTALTVEDAVRSADLAVDFVPDELESKLEIFSMVDRMAPPRTILLTPTDALSIADLASCTYRPDRCFAVRNGLAPGKSALLTHPPHTAPTALAAVAAFLRALGCAVQIEQDTTAPMLVKNL
jgi:3-hydroxybutyryl-CoA dehydrogenase